MKKCVYCKREINGDTVVDVCRVCGVGVWGEKMFDAIIQNMSGAREKGDLYQGSVWEGINKEEKKTGPLGSIVEEGLANAEKFAKSEEVVKFPSESSAEELIAKPIADIGIFKN